MISCLTQQQQKPKTSQVSPTCSENDLVSMEHEVFAMRLGISAQRATHLLQISKHNVRLLIWLYQQGHNLNQSTIDALVEPRMYEIRPLVRDNYDYLFMDIPDTRE
jgi:hypothetical protein